MRHKYYKTKKLITESSTEETALGSDKTLVVPSTPTNTRYPSIPAHIARANLETIDSYDGEF